MVYIKDAIQIMKRHFMPLLISASIGVIYIIPQKPESPITISFFLPTFFLLILTPLFYGQYVEIVIHKRQISYIIIFNTHWFNFIVVSILISSPVIILSLISTPFHGFAKIIGSFLSIFIDVFTIYIFPLIFILRKRIESVSLGFKCLLGNLEYSLPLIAFSLLPSVFSLLIDLPSKNINIISGLFLYCYFMLNLFISFLVFITATIVLNKKLKFSIV